MHILSPNLVICAHLPRAQSLSVSELAEYALVSSLLHIK